jgi:hypothetical protein
LTLLDQYPEIKEFYEQRGIMGGRCGFGDRPAIVVIDLARAWIDPDSPIGSALIKETVSNTVKILDVARKTNPKIPIYFTTMAYDPSLKDLYNGHQEEAAGANEPYRRNGMGGARSCFAASPRRAALRQAARFGLQGDDVARAARGYQA